MSAAALKDADDVRQQLGANGVHAMRANAVKVELPAPMDTMASKPEKPTLAGEMLAHLRIGVVTASDLQIIALPKHPLILEPWLADSDLGFIFAARGVGKTWFAMMLARAMAEGGRFGPWRATGRIPVLYIDGEMNAEQIKARDAGLTRAPAELTYLNHELLFERTERVINLCSPAWQEATTNLCLELGTRVLFLDNLSCLFGGMEENKNDAWEMVLPWLLHLRRMGIAVVIVHHAGRNSKEMRGASRREDSAAWVIRLDDALDGVASKNGARFVSLFTKPSRHTPVEVAPMEWEIRTDAASGLCDVSHKPATGLEVFRQWVESGVDTCGDIAEEMGISKGTVSKLAKKGEADGWLRIEGRRYIIAEGGAE